MPDQLIHQLYGIQSGSFYKSLPFFLFVAIRAPFRYADA